MILSLVILIFIAIIAYFHWVQGLFSATLSALIAIVAAVLAVSYHETIIETLLKGKMADSAVAMVLVVMFATIYIVLRVIFDKAIPGNMRFPSIVDSVGGGIMGAIAGIYAMGVFALAVQSMPFGPSIAGYSRYAIKGPQGVVVPTDRQSLDATLNDEVVEDSEHPGQFEKSGEKSLLIPVDDIVLATVQHLSDGGTLAGDRTLASIHPDYPQEMFGNRIGVQVGAKHTALNIGGLSGAKLAGVYTLPQLPAADPEFTTMRTGRKVPPLVKPTTSQILLVTRIMIDHNSSDDADSLFRFSTASVRLVANSKNYFPIGTVDNASTLMVQKPDDYLFLDTKAEVGVDLAFLVDKDDVLGGGKTATDTIADGVFVEVKRYAKLDLSGKQIDSNYTASPAINVMRKKLAMEKIKIAPAPTAAAETPTPAAAKPKKGKSTPKPVAAAPAENVPAISPDSAQVSPTIAVKIGVTTIDENAQNLAVAGGTVSLKGSKLASVSIEPTQTLDKLQVGDNQLNELYVPDGKKLVQVKGAWPAAAAAMPKLVDSAGTELAANGYFTIVNTGGKSGLLMHYAPDQSVDSVTAPSGTPGATTFLFVVPDGTQFKQINVAGTQVPLTLTAQ